MKRTIALLMALCMLLALCACGGKSTVPAPSVPDAPASADEDAAPDLASPEEEEPAQAAEEPAAEEEPAEEVSADEALGEKTSTSYSSALLGIRYDAPEGWYVLTDEETAQVMGYVANNTTSEVLADALRNSGSVCDMYAMDQNGSGETINIQLQDLGILYGMTLSEERYMEMARPQLETSLGQIGMQDITLENVTVVFAGSEHTALRIHGTMNGMELYELLVLIKSGNYMATVTAASLQDGRVDDILSAFSALD